MFSVDANVLLNVYRYSRDTREELVSFLEKIAHRLRLPYQFGLEFARNRCNVIMQQVENHKKVERELRKIHQEIFASPSRHPYLQEPHLGNFDSMLAALTEGCQEMNQLITRDPFLDRMLAAFEGKLGSAPSTTNLEDLYKEAKERFNLKIPPGYEDLKTKKEPEAYGDFIGWRQLMDIAKEINKDMILVIDDIKEDWWQRIHGQTLGPRPELLSEFSEKTGQRLYLYTSDNFLRYAKESGVAEISETVIVEVGQRLASQRESQRAGDEEKLGTVSVVSDDEFKTTSGGSSAIEKAEADNC